MRRVIRMSIEKQLISYNPTPVLFVLVFFGFQKTLAFEMDLVVVLLDIRGEPGDHRLFFRIRA